MRKSATRWLVGVLLWLFTATAGAQDLAAIPPLSSRVTDVAGILGASAKQELESKLAAFEQATGGSSRC